MNWDDLKAILMELLEDTKTIKKELQARANETEITRNKLAETVRTAAEQITVPNSVDPTALKLFVGHELQKIRRQLLEDLTASGGGKRGDIFSSDTRARNFKLIFESVCKWVGILVGGLFLLNTLLSLL